MDIMAIYLLSICKAFITWLNVPTGCSFIGAMKDHSHEVLYTMAIV